MNCNYRDLTNERFGRLTVLRRTEKNKHGLWLWECRCDCGKKTIVNSHCLRKGLIRSCGCMRLRMPNSEVPASKQPWYSSYMSMLDRCENPKRKKYHLYGGRGIKVCEEWHDINNFAKWVEENPWFKGASIDRIDVNGNYEPSNCRWATQKEQTNNRRNTIFLTYKGEKRCLSEWSEIVGLSMSVLESRYKLGWTTEMMLTTPYGLRDIPDETVENICKDIMSGMTYREIANKYGIKQCVVIDMARHRTYKDITEKYNFPKRLNRKDK